MEDVESLFDRETRFISALKNIQKISHMITKHKKTLIFLIEKIINK